MAYHLSPTSRINCSARSSDIILFLYLYFPFQSFPESASALLHMNFTTPCTNTYTCTCNCLQARQHETINSPWINQPHPIKHHQTTGDRMTICAQQHNTGGKSLLSVTCNSSQYRFYHFSMGLDLHAYCVIKVRPVVTSVLQTVAIYMTFPSGLIFDAYYK